MGIATAPPMRGRGSPAWTSRVSGRMCCSFRSCGYRPLRTFDPGHRRASSLETADLEPLRTRLDERGVRQADVAELRDAGDLVGEEVAAGRELALVEISRGPVPREAFTCHRGHARPLPGDHGN